MSFFCSIEKSILSWFLLTLTHRNVSELFVANGDVVFGGNTLDLRSRIDTREKDEEYWDTTICLCEGLEDTEWRLFDVFFTHHLADE